MVFFVFLAGICKGTEEPFGAAAFYEREHQSTRVTFNPKPGQGAQHAKMHTAQKTKTGVQRVGNLPNSMIFLSNVTWMKCEVFVCIFTFMFYYFF